MISWNNFHKVIFIIFNIDEIFVINKILFKIINIKKIKNLYSNRFLLHFDDSCNWKEIL